MLDSNFLYMLMIDDTIIIVYNVFFYFTFYAQILFFLA